MYNSLERIEILRNEAMLQDDQDLVDLCDIAIAGEDCAFAECEDVLLLNIDYTPDFTYESI